LTFGHIVVEWGMNLISRNRQVVTTETYIVETNGKKFTLIEYENQNGRVIDEELLDEAGSPVQDPALLDSIQLYIDKLPVVA
jgi:hypothetical protein